MSDPVINAQMLDLVMDFIEHNPQLHDQESWVGPKYDPEADEYCGTTCCFAGHALLLSGDYKLAVDPDDKENVDIVRIADDSTAIYFEQEAGDVLGLTMREAEVLFDGDNTREDLPRLISEIKAGNYR